jgi:hypothetical protein
MNTYVYASIPEKEGQEPEYFEFQPDPKDAALTTHPQTGKPIRRVVIGGYGALGVRTPAPAPDKPAKGGCGCGPKGCC